MDKGLIWIPTFLLFFISSEILAIVNDILFSKRMKNELH